MIKVKVGMAGYFKIDVIKPDGSIKELAPFQKNLILNQGLDNNLYKNYCHVGTGTSTPVVTQTGLDARVADVAGSGNSSVNSGSAPYYTDSTQTFTYAVGTFNGEALTEIGLGSTGLTSLWSRSLIKDSGGVPTSITILNDEILVVTYTIRIIPPTTDVVTVVGPHTCTVRATNVNSSGLWFMTFGSFFGSTAQFWAYTNYTLPAIDGAIPSALFNSSYGGTLPISYPAARTGRYTISLGVNDANAANGISGLRVNNWGGCSFSASFSPAIMKTSDDTLTLEIDITWDRV